MLLFEKKMNAKLSIEQCVFTAKWWKYDHDYSYRVGVICGTFSKH